MAEKKGFIIYNDFIHTVDKMNNEMAGELFRCMLNFANGRDVTTDNIAVELLFEGIKQQMIRDQDKYNKVAERNRENGKNGGRPRKIQNPNNPVGLSVTDNIPNEPKKPDRDTLIVIDTVNDTVNEKEKQGRFKPPTLLDVETYLIEKNYKTVVATSFWNFYESKNWYVGKNKMKDWKKAIAGWESRNNEQYDKKEQQEQGTGQGFTTNRPVAYKAASVNTKKLIEDLDADFRSGNIPGQY